MTLKLGVEIVSHETIKPSSPTPPSLRQNYKFSHMDQLCPHDQYVSYLLFYSNTAAAAVTDDDHHLVMKDALAETLARMYPLGGRANDDCMSIDCNDGGAEYIITRIDESMSTVLENPKTRFLQQLLPINLSSTWRPITTAGSCNDQSPLVALQINRFSCSGVAIGACIRHNVADASAASAFLQMWAAISCRSSDQKHNVLHDLDQKVIVNGQTTLFPPHDDLEVFKTVWKYHELSSREISRSHVTKLLVFDGPKVSALKEQNPSRTSTRVQAVTAFLWAAAISAAQDRNKLLEMHMLYTPVNLRNKIDPPLPAYSLGNILHLATPMWKKKPQESVDVHQPDFVLQLQDQLKNSIEMVTEDFVRKFHEDPGQYLSRLIAGIESMAKSREVVESFGAISWCRFPFYETDFGWGKPVWVATLAPQKDSAILIDTGDGEGIQAWLSLPKQDMDNLENDPNFLAYVSAIHTL